MMQKITITSTISRCALRTWGGLCLVSEVIGVWEVLKLIWGEAHPPDKQVRVLTPYPDPLSINCSYLFD
ncbi:hypothetical protein BOW53_02985 [Solemya pervernicosa gill symbiont]|uniref:Uncharacterized protein n=1 Tax=Solemya pervernicosa gill symbiont TaxID=642797 RepID=A0A1T2L976_9GAMM|nr:hypothetical protein [Solemya pervernicosa gill symbiont]OOZ41659.1 hypothetical protein BOW53_02985 [Solemya pervernicosa gill symbiont]